MKNTNNKIQKNRKNYKHQAGFTLIEIMVVLFIMLSIAGVSVIAIRAYLESGRKKTTKMYISNIETAIQTFNMDVGRNPASLQDLMACPSDVPTGKWNGPYTKNLQQTDPWQNEYRYNSPGQKVKDFDVWSPGPDGQDGTDDDIGNWTTD
jgi:general secretion pathway protein G